MLGEYRLLDCIRFPPDDVRSLYMLYEYATAPAGGFVEDLLNIRSVSESPSMTVKFNLYVTYNMASDQEI